MGLTNDTYFEKDEYMTVSQFKGYEKCQVLGGTPFTPTLPMLVGSYVDAFIEGTLEKFKEEHPELISSKGATKGELKADFKYADEICKYITGNERLMKFLGGEKQTIMTGVIQGVPFKSKMDSYIPDVLIADMKIMRTVTDNNGRFYDFITPFGYDVQLAVYQELVRQNTGKQLPVYIVAITKESPINSVIIQIPQTFLDKALYRVSSQVVDIYAVKMNKAEPVGCGVCDACIAKREVTPLISLLDIVGGY